ncbi:entry exclusion protein TrbK [Brucella sp. C7-11G]|jgi:Ti type entry exclusion protein TrbK|uniref:entry exclusion protein TrbK n=1 Tax=Agrobacterium pusense TaxID=648995 RepID=UPI000D19FF7B|nr:entry exclusion protein TrbK [Agrobacterium pusense]MBU0835239.1 entry exclusion protein TrbK [Alphaproteobacteria bacterium]QOD67242.1 entry exclusion protein TrbK [Ochrobactrum sp. MT180101]
MVRTKLILIAIATSLAIGSAGLWFLISEKQDAQNRRATFFGSSKTYPTSGGEKMKVEW